MPRRHEHAVTTRRCQTSDFLGGPIPCVAVVPLCDDRNDATTTTSSSSSSSSSSGSSCRSSCCCWHYLYYGQGPFLHRLRVHLKDDDYDNNMNDDWTTQTTIAQHQHDEESFLHDKLQIFDNENVHGLLLHCRQFFHHDLGQCLWVWGGRRLALVTSTSSSSSSSPRDDSLARVPLLLLLLLLLDSSSNKQSLHSLDLQDWIWNVRQIIEDDDAVAATTSSTLAVGLAHNQVQLLHVQQQQLRQQQQQPLHDAHHQVVVTWGPRILCATRCLLYCLAIHPTTRQVAVGSVTQGILVWTLPQHQHTTITQATTTTTNMPNIEPLVPVTAQLTQHQGVIHGLAFDEPTGQWLASASDDRTIRLWKRSSDNDSWTLQWTAYGHAARCWKVALVAVEDKRIKMVISTAEDGTARAWNGATGAALAVWQGHASPNIWSLAVVVANPASGTTTTAWVATGGGNGTLALHPWKLAPRGNADKAVNDLVNDKRKNENACQSSWIRRSTTSIPDDRPPLQDDDKTVKTNNDKPRKKAKRKVLQQIIMGTQFCTIDDAPALLVATRNGSLFSFNTETASWTRRCDWCSATDSAQGGIHAADGISFALHPSLPMAAVGLKSGQVLFTSLTNATLEEEEDQTRVLGTLPSHGLRGPSRMVWITPQTLAIFHAQTIRIWHLPHVLDTPPKVTDSALCGSFSSGLKAVVTCVALDEKFVNGLIAVGDNRGHVCIYKLVYSSVENQVTAPLSIRRLHGKEHVNDIRWTSPSSLVSAGNDGMLCQFTVSLEGILTPGISLPIFSFSGVVQILPLSLISSSLNYCVAGYVGNKLSVMDPSSGYEFLSIDTGGRGRGCTLHMDQHSRISVAICSNLKDGLNELHVERHDILQCFSPRALKWSYGIPFHHETIFHVCSFPLPGGRVGFVTGSEDCSSRLSIWSKGSVLFSQPLTPQESGVRTVCSAVYSDRKSCLIVVGGSKLALQFFLSQYDNDPETDIRVQLLGHGRLHKDASIDHRINALASTRMAVAGHGRKHLVASGDSSGKIFLYVVDESSDRPSNGTPVYESERPILALDFFNLGNKTWLVFGTSGGQVGLLEILFAVSETGQFEGSTPLVASYQGHSVGTNSISTMHMTTGDDECALIASGGDDQRVTLCKASVDVSNNGCPVSLSLTDPYFQDLASSSAIRSVDWIGQSRLAVVGYSAQLAVWNIVDDNKLELEETAHVQVGDINDMTVAKPSRNDSSRALIAVAGSGLQLFEYSM